MAFFLSLAISFSPASINFVKKICRQNLSHVMGSPLFNVVAKYSWFLGYKKIMMKFEIENRKWKEKRSPLFVRLVMFYKGLSFKSSGDVMSLSITFSLSCNIFFPPSTWCYDQARVLDWRFHLSYKQNHIVPQKATYHTELQEAQFLVDQYFLHLNCR